jgi:hypothetical protein
MEIGRPSKDVEVRPRALPSDACQPRQDYPVMDPDKVDRRFTCRYYDACLDHAYRQKWGSFSCGGCDVQEPVTRLQERSDMVGLAGVLEEVFRRRN